MRVAIIGAGAGGCFAAANLKRQGGMEIFVFEKTSKALQKVKVSGGGRCNVTHACFDIPKLVERYPRGNRFLRKTLHRFTPQHTIAWFEEREVSLKTEDDGRMFPVTDDSQTIIDCIWGEMMKNKVQVRYHKAVERIEKVDEQLMITFKDETSFLADRVIIACGGFAKKEQFSWLEHLGHTIEYPVPSLFTFNLHKNPITELMGVSVANVTVKIAGTKLTEHGPLLITHWGFSGPAILKCSAWGARILSEHGYDFIVLINWLGDVKDNELQEQIAAIRREKGKVLVHNKNSFELPKRLWSFLLEKAGVSENTNWGELPAKQQNRLIQILVNDEYPVSGKTTFKEEFVTCGGVKLQEVDPKTMESRLVKGIFFAGEILDVDGITGGYNFQHAWSSGFIAAESINAEVN